MTVGAATFQFPAGQPAAHWLNQIINFIKPQLALLNKIERPGNHGPAARLARPLLKASVVKGTTTQLASTLAGVKR